MVSNIASPGYGLDPELGPERYAFFRAEIRDAALFEVGLPDICSYSDADQQVWHAVGDFVFLHTKLGLMQPIDYDEHRRILSPLVNGELNQLHLAFAALRRIPDSQDIIDSAPSRPANVKGSRIVVLREMQTPNPQPSSAWPRLMA